MARTAKIEADPRKAAPLPDLSAEKTNGPTREDGLFMLGQFLQADEKIKEARTLKKRLRQRAKNLGINLTMFDLAVEEMERDDDTTIGNMRDFKTYCGWFELPIGSQFTLFDTPQDGSAASQQSVNEKAYADGYQRGIMGDDPDEQAYPRLTVEGSEHQRGWNAGQDVNKEKLAKQSEDFAADEAAKKAKRAKKTDTGETVQ